MLPSLRGLGPRRLPTPGPGRRLAPRRLLPHRLARARARRDRLASGRLAILLHRLASHGYPAPPASPPPGRPRCRAGPGRSGRRFPPGRSRPPGAEASSTAASSPGSPARPASRTGLFPARPSSPPRPATPPPRSRRSRGTGPSQLQSPNPLSTAKCLAMIKLRCYSPLQYRVAYDLDPLYAEGVTGKGQTIMIVDSFGSPTIRRDLAYFDRQWGLPDPPSTCSSWASCRRSTSPARPWTAGPKRPPWTSSTPTRSRPRPPSTWSRRRSPRPRA